MRHSISRLSVLTTGGLVLAALTLGSGNAHAQALGANGFRPVVGAPKAPPKAPTAPSGLPGATAPEGGVAPPQVLPSDMQPTDALFDAINRGDITTARDAMGRGADMNARNILGMTPLELSVDLSRNDITFYLLSLRGGSDAAEPPPRTALDKAPTKTRRPERVVPAAAHRVVPTPKAATPQYAGGGTPDPSAGFLGFGGDTQIR